MDALKALGINAGNLFVNIVCFAIAALIIVRFIMKPIQNMMDKRQAIIDKGLEDAAAAAEAKKNAQANAENLLAQTRDDCNKLLSQAKNQAEQTRKDYMLDAENKIKAEQIAAKEEIAKEKAQTLSDLRSEIVDLSIAGAKQLVGESLLENTDKQKKIIAATLTGIRDGKLVDVSSFPANVRRIDITTAIPLTDEEKAITEKELARTMEKNASIRYLVDPKILGGMIIQSDEKIIDASLSAKSQTLRDAMLN